MKTYEELEEELAYFKQALKVEQSENRLAKLSKTFGFTPTQAKLALAIYDRAGKVLTKEFALEILYPNPDESAEEKILNVLVCKIRTKLIYYCGNQKPIDTVWGRGFQMSPAGMAIFAKALGEAPPSVAQAEQIAARDMEIERLIDQRDAAEEALSQAYFLVIGRSPEWSNVFGYSEALEEIDDAQHTFRAALTPQLKDQSHG